MREFPLTIKHRTAESLASAFFSSDIDEWSAIQLTISLEESSLNCREFGAFLSVIDSVYGRITRTNYYSYSHFEHGQLNISEVRKGSTELIVADVITQVIQVTPYVLLLLFIRYLGIGIKGASEVSKNFADSYKSTQEGKLAKLNQKKILQDMEADENLKDLTSSQRRQLINLLVELENVERKRIPAARRFVQKSVKEVKIARKKIDRNSSRTI